jgi:hypothetical protein
MKLLCAENQGRRLAYEGYTVATGHKRFLSVIAGGRLHRRVSEGPLVELAEQSNPTIRGWLLPRLLSDSHACALSVGFVALRLEGRIRETTESRPRHFISALS